MAKTYISSRPCKRGHFVRYLCAHCVQCAKERVRSKKSKARPKATGAEQRLIDLLTEQLKAQKERWGFI